MDSLSNCSLTVQARKLELVVAAYTWKDAEMVEEILYTQAPASNFLMHSEELFTVFERVNKNYYAITL